MRFVIQRVTEASVMVDGQVLGEIGKGFLVLIGVGKDDTTKEADCLVKKMTGLRIFEDENGKTNLSLSDVGGSLLLISQFTLYADCRKGNRPNFMAAGRPEMSEPLYAYLCDTLRGHGIHVETGIFGADMQVSLVNDGPVTIVLER